METTTDGGRQRSRPKRRELFCPSHLDEFLVGNGKKYFLHLLNPDQLVQRGMKATKAKLIIQFWYLAMNGLKSCIAQNVAVAAGAM